MRLPHTRVALRCRGMALLLILIVVMALALVVGALWESSGPGWEENTLDRARHQAGLLAESGLAVALHPEIEPGDAALRHEIAPGRGYEVRITSEEGRFPVNNLATEAWRLALVELFIQWGVGAADASIAADSLADWIDADSDALPNGAENPYYAGFQYEEYPPNAPFTSVEEMLFVNGMDRVARFQPNWRDYFTVHGIGLVDLNEAPWETVAAITGTTSDSAINFAAARAGEDGVVGTLDDYRYEDSGEVQALLGLTDDEWTDISGFVTLVGGTRRIESTGRVGEFTATRSLLVQEITRNGGSEWIVMARFR